MLHSFETGKFEPVDQNWRGWMLNVFAAFRAAWGLPLVALALMLKHKEYLRSFLYAVSCSALIFLTLFVGDVARSLAFAFPMVMVAVVDIYRYVDVIFAKRVVAVILTICIMMPGYIVGGHGQQQKILMNYSLPLVLLRMKMEPSKINELISNF